jgi:uncharacterized protein YjdB
LLGGSETLTETVLPSNATNKSVQWSSSAESIATVSDAGLVTGVSNGIAIVSVTTDDGEFIATCEVAVLSNDIEDEPRLEEPEDPEDLGAPGELGDPENPEVPKVTESPIDYLTVPVASFDTPTKEIYIKKGDNVRIPIVAYGKVDGVNHSMWSVTKSKVATIGGDRQISSGVVPVPIATKANPGNVIIINVKGFAIGKTSLTITSSNGATITLKISVVKKIKKVVSFKVSETKKTYKINSTGKIKVNIVTLKATGAVPIFKSSNKKCICIDRAGKITFLKSPGKRTVKITIKVGNKKTTIKFKYNKKQGVFQRIS